MAYTVKQVAAMSGVSVRTLHFYDESDLLSPAYVGPNGYRFYEEPQLLILQQILFYRELGFELKRIKPMLGRTTSAQIPALESHRHLLQKKVAQTNTLLETIDRTIAHLKGTMKMKTEEMFAGFSVAAGQDRFGEPVELAGEPHHCKVSARDTAGAMCIFEFTGHNGGPRHLHQSQDEWIYVASGEFEFQVAEKSFRLRAGESVFVPRKTPHAWAAVGDKPGKILNTYQPAGTMEDFFRAVGNFEGAPSREEVMEETYTQKQVDAIHQLFREHGMDVVGPPLISK
jgi:DNA-binding transcriptional MerR regulator/quercetin dioxygenase-like cupin family protein